MLKARKLFLWMITVVILFSFVPSKKVSAAEQPFGNTIASANGRGYVIQKDGSLWYWGKATFNETAGDQSPQRASKTKLLDNVISVYGDWWSGLAIKSDNSLWSIEYNSEQGVTQAIKVMDGVKEAASSYTDWLILKNDGTVWQRSIHSYPQTPEQVMSGVKQISAGIESYYALKDDGSLWGWGDNYSGALGVKTKSSKMGSPIEIMTDVETVYGAGMDAFAIKNDGSLWGWGKNSNGIIYTGKKEKTTFTYPDGSQGVVTAQFTPVKLMDDVLKVNGRNHMAVIKKDHSLWLWGSNEDGQLGDGSTKSRFTPAKVLDGIIDVTAKGAFTIALKSDGTLWGFGTNAVGELGLGSYDREPHQTPLQLMDHVAIPNMAASFPSEWAKEDILYAGQKNLLPVHLQSHYQDNITRKDFVTLIVQLIKTKTGKDLDAIIKEKGLKPAPSFKDTTDDKDILNISTCNIINGVGEGRFDPDGLLTREQAAVILTNTAKFLGIDSKLKDNSDPAFEDDKEISTWAMEAVHYCTLFGIMGGTGDHLFSPQDYFSREMSIVTLVRLSKN